MTYNKGQEEIEKYDLKKDSIIKNILPLLDGLNYLQIEDILESIKDSAKYSPVKTHSKIEEEAIQNMYDLSKGDGWDIEIKSKFVIDGYTYVTLSIMGSDGKDHGALMPICSVAEQLKKGIPTY